MAERVIVPEMDLTGIIAESRDVAKALNEFADDFERIDKKYANVRLQENEGSLCDSCANKGCWSRYQYGPAENHCVHYKKEE